jgi:hypothetical protein
VTRANLLHPTLRSPPPSSTLRHGAEEAGRNTSQTGGRLSGRGVREPPGYVFLGIPSPPATGRVAVRVARALLEPAVANPRQTCTRLVPAAGDAGGMAVVLGVWVRQRAGKWWRVSLWLVVPQK